MASLHDLATTIGTSSLLSILSALAAGLAAAALISGSAKVRRSALPGGFPVDPEAQLDKYILSFNQLDQLAKEGDDSLSTAANQLKNQPAVLLGLTAFDKFNAGKKSSNSTSGTKPTAAIKAPVAKPPTSPEAAAAQTKPYVQSSSASNIPALPSPRQADDEDDSTKTVNVSLPKDNKKGRDRK